MHKSIFQNNVLFTFISRFVLANDDNDFWCWPSKVIWHSIHMITNNTSLKKKNKFKSQRSTLKFKHKIFNHVTYRLQVIIYIYYNCLQNAERQIIVSSLRKLGCVWSWCVWELWYTSRNVFVDVARRGDLSDRWRQQYVQQMVNWYCSAHVT